MLGPTSTLLLHPVRWRGQLLELRQKSTADAEENNCQSRFILVVIDFLTWNIAQLLRYSRKDPQKLVDLKYKTCVQPTADCRQSLHTNPGPLDEGEFYSNFCCFASNAVTVQFRL